MFFSTLLPRDPKGLFRIANPARKHGHTSGVILGIILRDCLGDILRIRLRPSAAHGRACPRRIMRAVGITPRFRTPSHLPVLKVLSDAEDEQLICPSPA